ncbi:intercellular adhesion molecule 1-like isoform X1 [Hippocampus zosterae]|uniref:intercellular adhesion molecule 1-like isoform X1 n=1 Tax=Hippocampus zosterae TaxID=109293 RepID=UPI00223CE79A|nr:intercellular adhesion molecule 1-like isoform X1 [Hippocampus zosterae]
MIVIIFSCLILYAAKPASTSCPLEITPNFVLVPFGGSISAVCKSLSSQLKGMGWESSFGGTGLVKGVSNLTLKIDSLQSWHVSPICFVNLNGSQCTKDLPVTVYKMPDNVSISLESHVGPMSELEPFVVRCEVNQIASIQNVSLELLNGNERVSNILFNNFDNKEPVSKSFYFFTLSKREYNGAQFRCKARIDLGPLGHLPEMSSEPLELIVHYAPTFSQPTNETLTLQVGSQMSLDCSASGNPLPEYSWKMPYTSKVLTETQSVFNSSFKHPGPYECTAANSQGTITKRFTITQAPRPRRTLALMLGLFVGLAVMLCILGYFFVTPQGTFSSKKQSYTPGSATSAPV